MDSVLMNTPQVRIPTSGTQGMQLVQFSQLVSERAESKIQAAKIQHSKPCAWSPLPHSSLVYLVMVVPQTGSTSPHVI